MTDDLGSFPSAGEEEEDEADLLSNAKAQHALSKDRLSESTPRPVPDRRTGYNTSSVTPTVPVFASSSNPASTTFDFASLPNVLGALQVLMTQATSNQSSLISSQVEQQKILALAIKKNETQKPVLQAEEKFTFDSISEDPFIDDSHEILSWDIRSKLKPIPYSSYKSWWNSDVPIKSSPILAYPTSAHLSDLSVSEVGWFSLHDRKAELRICWFSKRNGLKSRSEVQTVKVQGGDDSATKEINVSRNFKKLTSVKELATACLVYNECLSQIRSYDWTGRILLYTMHRFNWLRSVVSDKTKQLSMLEDVVDQFLEKNRARARQSQPPLDERELVEHFKAYVLESGFPPDKLTSGSIYSAAAGFHDTSGAVGGSPTRGPKDKDKKKRGPSHSAPTGPKRFRSSTAPSSSQQNNFVQQLQQSCRDFNTKVKKNFCLCRNNNSKFFVSQGCNSSCSRSDRHYCNMLVGTSRLCMDTGHGAYQHK